MPEPSTDGLTGGLHTTRGTLAAWGRKPLPVASSWVVGSALAAALLLVGVLVVAELVPSPGSAELGGPPFRAGDVGDVLTILHHNLLVLLLHLLACVAGFIAGYSVPLQARSLHGLNRTVHVYGARAAIVFVAIASAASMGLQAYTIGHIASGAASSLQTSPAKVLLGVLPHAAPELFALFLPLAAWVRAARRGEWQTLLAAALVTMAISVPILIACACWETWVAPHVLLAVIGRN
jgi:hypothetical protein